MKIKRFIGFILTLALVLTAFVGCGGEQKASADKVKWTINIEGIKDEAISFTNIDGEKVGLKEIKAIMKKKDGSETEQTWKGYGLKEVLDYLKAEEYSAVVVEAGDGYSKELPKDLVMSEETILGVIKDGEALEDDNKVQLVVNGKGSNWWIKGVAKIKLLK
ncbi:molybdopterin-dependent oxidoreductase [Paramaledivibacter caminithermalis]|jgi:DMSO/TMAO reductase YedYZ molybdopterin-dependent catalytic subunit|uniref:Oxidoreductase molybdopterin binding domain-containing protein n=1 Tax=Paramaledivibacter caminithermalis (strain DSM 15212 / CIP 107654 / DViRD3) TaxID=1121301 RepID=A0A1M6QSN8_PARC5|nr:molybdopterin-dependent oxidoreductase [Paramaledivibacter caminithermalis]SHK23133.1 Oxidoreductase molybdopterin binding domain-containing protein [Paramaledivibacter caminithermalis DSM 15212]